MRSAIQPSPTGTHPSVFRASPRTLVRGSIRHGALGVAAIGIFLLGLTMSASVGANGLPDGAFTSVGCPVGNYSCYSAAVGQPYPAYIYPNSAYQPYAGATYQFTDSRYCDDGLVTATPQGYFCTTTGVPIYLSGSITTAPAVTAVVVPPDTIIPEGHMQHGDVG